MGAPRNGAEGSSRSGEGKVEEGVPNCSSGGPGSTPHVAGAAGDDVVGRMPAPEASPAAGPEPVRDGRRQGRSPESAPAGSPCRTASDGKPLRTSPHRVPIPDEAGDELQQEGVDDGPRTVVTDPENAGDNSTGSRRSDRNNSLGGAVSTGCLEMPQVSPKGPRLHSSEPRPTGPQRCPTEIEPGGRRSAQGPGGRRSGQSRSRSRPRPQAQEDQGDNPADLVVKARSDADCARHGAVDVTGPQCSAHGAPEVSPATEGTVKVNSGREEDRSTLEEPEPKRAKPDNGGTGMELDSLRKIVTVKSWTQVVAGPTPEE